MLNPRAFSIHGRQILLLLFVFLCCLAWPSIAWANAGTPLMWAGALHLLFGNLIVGLAEGLIIGFVFRVGKLRAVWLMILANYFSAWVGGAWIVKPLARSVHVDLYTAWPFFWKMVVFAYLITLLLEVPFVAFCFWKKERWLLKTILASLLVQTLSYVVLFGWYWSASGTSLYTETQLVQPSAMKLPDDVVLYYIAASDGDVYACHLNENDDKLVFDLNSNSSWDRLYEKQVSDENGNSGDLMVWLYVEGEGKASSQLVKENFTPKVARSKVADQLNNWTNFLVPKLGEAEQSEWNFDTGDYSMEGLHGSNKQTGQAVRIAFETLFVEWNIRNAVLLPGDVVLFQLGDDQICLFDPNTRQLALLVKGRGPVAAIEKESASPETPKQKE